MTKDSVLAILKNTEGYLSGEKISTELGLSRMAVSTAVKALRKEGYDILSSTNKGYLLNHSPDRLTSGELMAYLSPERMKSVVCLDTVDSTNRQLRRMALEGAADGQIVLANEQTEGLGRLGRSFLSPRDKGVYLSVLMCPDVLPSESVAITARAAVAACNAIYSVCGVRPGIKWLNDLVLNKKKLCGILTEMSVESEIGHVQYVIVGIGVNVNEMPCDFPEGIRKAATSLAAETGLSFSRARLAAELIKELDRLRFRWTQEKQLYWETYCADSVTLGREIRIISGEKSRTGTAVSIQSDYSLTVRYPDGLTETLSNGEVRVRGIDSFS